MNSHPAQVDDLQLVALPSAVNCVEIFVRFALIEWSLPVLQDEATKTARALVAAVVEATDSKEPGFITVRLQLRGDCLALEVEDDQPAAPLPSLPGKRSGVEQLNGVRKVVWCEVPLPAGVSAAEVQLPRRDGRRSLVTEQMAGEPAEVDPQVVERVLHGLSKYAE